MMETYRPVRAIHGFTKDHLGNAKRWERMTGIPAFCPDDMVERRLRRRHFALFGVPPCVLVSWRWGGPADGQ